MASLRQVTEAIAEIRGMPYATVESYNRPLRQDSVLPPSKRGRGATPIGPSDAAKLLLAVMRGSPKQASENAQEMAKLMVSWTPGEENAMRTTLRHFGWPDEVCFSDAIGSLIDRFANRDYASIGETSPYDEHVLNDIKASLKISISRYEPLGEIRFRPQSSLRAQIADALSKDLSIPKEDIEIPATAEIYFIHPAYYTLHVSHGVDKEKNDQAAQEIKQLRERLSDHDLHGNEWVTQSTIEKLAEVFRD